MPDNRIRTKSTRAVEATKAARARIEREANLYPKSKLLIIQLGEEAIMLQTGIGNVNRVLALTQQIEAIGECTILLERDGEDFEIQPTHPPRATCSSKDLLWHYGSQDRKPFGFKARIYQAWKKAGLGEIDGDGQFHLYPSKNRPTCRPSS